MHVDGLVQERRKSSALAMELHLSCINPSMYCPNRNYEVSIVSILENIDNYILKQHCITYISGAHINRKISNTRRTQYQNLNVSRFICGCLCAIFWSQLFNRELHLSDKQFYYLRCNLYQRFYGTLWNWNNIRQVLQCHVASLGHNELTHWGRLMHICVSKLYNHQFK